MASPIVLRTGDPVTVLGELVKEMGITEVFVTGDSAPQGIRRDNAVREARERDGRTLTAVSTNYAVKTGTVLSEKEQPLKVFSAFRRRWETRGPQVVLGTPDVHWLQAPSTGTFEQMRLLAGSQRPTLFGDLPDGPPAVLPLAGEAAAQERLNVFTDEHLDQYKERRDLMAVDGTSGLSPYLRFGCIHPRTILAASEGLGEGRSTFRSEIAWREFYADVLFHHPESITTNLQPQLAALEWDSGPIAEERFRRWAAGETGIPLVDAANRQLLGEGLMHNRARMVSASFLVKHLHLDWRWGAAWFMWRLVDGDIASNQQGWQWTAGTGTDAAPFHRVFNPVAQAERFDPKAEYIHRWVPELAEIEAPGVLQPGGGVNLLQQADYPEPMIDLKEEREEALRRFAVARDLYRARQ